MQNLHRDLRANSIGESSMYGGAMSIPELGESKIDTNKYLREQPSLQSPHEAAGSLFRPFTETKRDLSQHNRSEPSMVPQDESSYQRRTRNLEFQRQFDQLANLNYEQQKLLQDIAAGKITSKDIPAYVAQNSNFRGLTDRTFLGANSNISFEELSASERAGSVKSLPPVQLKPQTSLNVPSPNKAQIDLNQSSSHQ